MQGPVCSSGQSVVLAAPHSATRLIRRVYPLVFACALQGADSRSDAPGLTDTRLFLDMGLSADGSDIGAPRLPDTRRLADMGLSADPRSDMSTPRFTDMRRVANMGLSADASSWDRARQLVDTGPSAPVCLSASIGPPRGRVHPLHVLRPTRASQPPVCTQSVHPEHLPRTQSVHPNQPPRTRSVHFHHQQGDKVKSTERPASKPTRIKGSFATLRASISAKGTRTPFCALQGAHRRASRTALCAALTLAALAFTATPALAAAPTVISESSSSAVKATEARVEAVVNAGNEVTECHFQYGALSVSEHEVPCEAEVLGGEEQTVGVTLSGLTGHTPYVYRVVLKNLAAEEAMGAEEPFETATTPEVPVTEAPELVTGNTATLRGELNPASTAKDGYHFAYNTNGECTGGATSAPGEEEEATKRKVSTPVTGLEPLREYTVCVASTNAAGEETLGNAVTFSTPAAPAIVESESASNIKSTEATLEGSVNPNNQLTECHFSYGISTVAENTVPCTPELLKGFGGQSVAPNPQPLTGLTPGSEYKYDIHTKNGKGEESTGPEEHFKTAEEPEKQPAEPITATTATLKGVLDPHNPFEAGTYEFTYEQSASECIGPKGPHGELPYKTAPNPRGSVRRNHAARTGVMPKSPPCSPARPTPTACLQRNAAGQQAAISAPETFTTLSEAPAITVEFASNIQEAGVILNAQINPDGAETTYQFQYGTTESYGHSEPATPAKLEGPLTATDTAAANLTGLAPATTYHYRVIAANTVEGKTETTEGKDKTFTTPAAPGSEPPQKCPENEQRRAEQPFAQALPDCRAYEMVSPLNTEGQDATEPEELLAPGKTRAAASGEAVTFGALGSYAEPEGAIFENQFLSRREPGGWSTRSITAPSEAYQTGTLGGYIGAFFTPDLTAGVTSTYAALTEEARSDPKALGLQQLYRSDLAGGYTWLSHLAPSEEPYMEQYRVESGSGVYPLGASEDLSHVVFVAGQGAFGDLHESAGGRVFPVGVSNTGEPWEVTIGGNPGFNYPEFPDVWRAVSADGTRVIFNYAGQVYVRQNGEQEQSKMKGEECLEPAKACTIAVSPATAQFWGASTDASTLFYTESEDLYEYTLEPGHVAGHAAPLTTGGKVQGVVQVSEDGSYVYFVADGNLAAGAVEGKPNLYVSHDGGAPALIATLSTNDGSDWKRSPGAGTAAVTPSGGRLAFVSEDSLTGYDNQQAEHGECEGQFASNFPEIGNGKCREVFLFDAETGVLVCASCDPSGARPLGNASLTTSSYHKSNGASDYRPRDLLEDATLFFNSSDALVAHASDGRQNVYEYEHGRVFPISNVAGGFESFFLDASADGRDVFFATSDQLVRQDVGSNVVVYDARAGGGFPAPPSVQPCVNGDSCKPPVSPQPGAFAPPASATFSGPGNAKPSPPPPPKGKTAAQIRAEKLAVALKALPQETQQAQAHDMRTCGTEEVRDQGVKDLEEEGMRMPTLKPCRENRSGCLCPSGCKRSGGARSAPESCTAARRGYEKQARKKFGAKASAKKSARNANNYRRAGR